MPVFASPSQMRSGINLNIKQKRGGPGTSGSGASGRKCKPARLLARLLADRPLVAKIERERQAARVAAKNTPPVLAGWPLDPPKPPAPRPLDGPVLIKSDWGLGR